MGHKGSFQDFLVGYQNFIVVVLVVAVVVVVVVVVVIVAVVVKIKNCKRENSFNRAVIIKVHLHESGYK